MSPSDRLHAAHKATGEPKIALAVDLYDWHARDLTAAFARAGAMAVPVRLSQCGFDTRRRSSLVNTERRRLTCDHRGSGQGVLRISADEAGVGHTVDRVSCFEAIDSFAHCENFAADVCAQRQR